MLKNKIKKSIYKRVFLKKNPFRIKFLKSFKNHLLINKSKFFKKYLRKRFFYYNLKFLKKILF